MNYPAMLAGVGHTRFGRMSGRGALELEVEAAKMAVTDAGLTPADIDGLLTDPGPAQGIIEGITPHYLALGQTLGLDPAYTGSELLGGAGSVALIQRAARAIEAGLCTACLCVYGDAPSSTPGSFSYGRGNEAAFGLFGAAGLHAMAAARHMYRWGTRQEHLAEVAIAASLHASRTPHAQKRKILTREEYEAAEWVVEPLKIADCCLVSDGAAAVIVTTRERARDLQQPRVDVLSYSQAHSFSTWSSTGHFDSLPAARSGPIAFERAGVTVNDIDIAMLYDCFTIVVLMQLEDYGFCEPGKAGEFVAAGGIRPGGELPVNTSGGLLAEGYGGGMLHVIEAVRQLQGRADARQVEDAKLALVSGHGLGMNTHTTLILGAS